MGDGRRRASRLARKCCRDDGVAIAPIHAHKIEPSKPSHDSLPPSSSRFGLREPGNNHVRCLLPAAPPTFLTRVGVASPVLFLPVDGRPLGRPALFGVAVAALVLVALGRERAIALLFPLGAMRGAASLGRWD